MSSRRALDRDHASLARRRLAACVVAGLALTLALARARGARGTNVHRADADCRTCHTAASSELRGDSSAARTALVPDLEARCMVCHADQGPSHRTGIAPRTPPPATLPLTRGRITCSTCHFVHGEGDRHLDFVRIDNRRGALCLTCHKLAELQ